MEDTGVEENKEGPVGAPEIRDATGRSGEEKEDDRPREAS